MHKFWSFIFGTAVGMITGPIVKHVATLFEAADPEDISLIAACAIAALIAAYHK